MMAVSRCRITGVEYFKVYRKIAEARHQKYFSIGTLGEEPARKLAEAEDAKLAQRQRAYVHRLMYTTDYLIRANGLIRGLTLTHDGRGNRLLRVQLRVPWESSQQRFGASVERYGETGAFAKAIDFLIDRLGLDPLGELAQRLWACFPVYFPEQVSQGGEAMSADELNEWATILKQAIGHFAEKHK